MDLDATQVNNLRKINIKSYFGDATRPDLLHTAGMESAQLIVVAIDNRESAKTLVQHVKATYPNVKVLARSFDRGHNYELRHVGADVVINETYFSALELGAEAMRSLDFDPFYVEQKKHVFCKTEVQASELLYQQWEQSTEGEQYDHHFRTLFIQLEETIKQAMKADRMDKHNSDERGWTPPPKGYEQDFTEH